MTMKCNSLHAPNLLLWNNLSTHTYVNNMAIKYRTDHHGVTMAITCAMELTFSSPLTVCKLIQAIKIIFIPGPSSYGLRPSGTSAWKSLPTLISYRKIKRKLSMYEHCNYVNKNSIANILHSEEFQSWHTAFWISLLPLYCIPDEFHC